MRIIPEADGALDGSERAAWLTMPFDDANGTPPVPPKNGAPTVANMNAFEPFCGMKTPKGDLIIVNGIDRGRFWDGYLGEAWLAGIDAPTDPPTVSPASGGAATEGTYACYYRFLDHNDQPSSLSPVAKVDAQSGDRFDWTFSVSDTPDKRVTKRQLWRSIVILQGSVAAANVLYLIAEIDDNTTTTFTDTFSDDELIAAAVADNSKTMNIYNPDGSPDAIRFTPPPAWKKVAMFFQDRAFYLGDVAYNKGTVSVVKGSTIVTGINAGWTSSFLGRFFYGIGAPKGYEIGQVEASGGPVTIVNAGGAGADCVQTVQFGSTPTSGTWTLGLGGAITTPLAFGASAADVQAALEGLATIGAGNVSVAGSTASGFTVTFQGAKAKTPMPQLTADGRQLHGSGTIAVVEVQAGSGGGGSGKNQIQVVGFEMIDNATGGVDAALPPGSAAGTWSASFQGQSMPVPVHQPGGQPNQMAAGDVVTALLQSISTIGAGNCQATPQDTLPFAGNGQILYRVEFTGSLGGQELTDLITGGVTNVGNNFPGQATPTPKAYIVQKGGGSGGGGGGGAKNEIQKITLPAGASGGTWTASPGGCTTAPMAANATGAAVQAALTASCGANYNVTGAAGGPWTVEFVGTLAGNAQPPIVCNSSSLLGVEIETAITTEGAAGGDCVQSLNLGGATGGTFVLSFGGYSTAALPFDATAAQIQAAFTAMASVGAGNCTVTGSGGVFQFTFQGALANSGQPLITCDVGSLVGYQETSTITLTEPYGGATDSDVIYCIRPRPEERNLIYCSEQGEPESVPIDNVIRCQQFTNVDDEIVGAMIYGPFMYVLMSSHIVSFSYGKVPMIDGDLALSAQRGAFNQRCWDYVDGTAFLMDSEGAYAFDGANVQPISGQIEDYWRDGIIDFSNSKRFWVRASAAEELIRFGVCFSGDTYPRQSLTYNYRQKTWAIEEWHQEMGAAVVYPISGRRRFVLCGSNDTIHLANEGYADGIDSTTEAGTIRGSVTSATANTLTDAAATFTTTMIGAPVAIVSGTGAGQRRTISASTATELTVDENWATQPDTTSVFMVGSIDWTLRTGILQFAPPGPSGRGGQYTPATEADRQLRITWRPTAATMEFAISRYLNHDANPEENAQYADLGNGLTAEAGATYQVQDVTASRDDSLAISAKTAGFTRYQFSHTTEDSLNVDRWVSVELFGHQAQDTMVLYALEFFGVME